MRSPGCWRARRAGSRECLLRAAGDDDALARDEPLLATLARASLRTRIATGPHAGERWRRLGDRVDPRDTTRSEEDGGQGALTRFHEAAVVAAASLPDRT
jgi:hypothetical protein